MRIENLTPKETSIKKFQSNILKKYKMNERNQKISNDQKNQTFKNPRNIIISRNQRSLKDQKNSKNRNISNNPNIQIQNIN